MGFLDKFIQTADTEEEIEVQQSPTEENINFVSEDTNMFDVKAEDFVAEVYKSLSENGEKMDAMNSFVNYMKTLPEVMSDKEKASVLNGILSVANISLNTVQSDIATASKVLSGQIDMLKTKLSESNDIDMKVIADAEHAIEEAKKAIEARKNYGMSAEKFVQIELERLASLQSFTQTMQPPEPTETK